MNLGFITILAKLALEGIEHQFGCDFPPRVFGNHGGIQGNAFTPFVLLDVVGVLLLRLAPGGVTATFLFDF